jgi:hypothetical protein
MDDGTCSVQVKTKKRERHESNTCRVVEVVVLSESEKSLLYTSNRYLKPANDKCTRCEANHTTLALYKHIPVNALY